MVREKEPVRIGKFSGKAQNIQPLASPLQPSLEQVVPPEPIPQRKEYKTSGGRTVILRHPHKILIIDSLTAAGDKGSSVRDLARTITNSPNPTPKDIGNVSKQVCFLRKDGFPIENRTPASERRKGGRSHYFLSGIRNDQRGIEGALKTNGQSDVTEDRDPEDPQDKHLSPWREWDSHENTHLRPDKRLNELYTKTTEGFLGVKATVQVLSSLLEGSLTRSTKDIETLLAKTINMNRLDFGRMKLDELFNETSQSRLNKFFQVKFTAIVDDCWNKEITPDTPKDERQIIEIINKLKENFYDKTRVFQEVLGHFGIKIPAEYVVSFTSSPAL